MRIFHPSPFPLSPIHTIFVDQFYVFEYGVVSVEAQRWRWYGKLFFTLFEPRLRSSRHYLAFFSLGQLLVNLAHHS